MFRFTLNCYEWDENNRPGIGMVIVTLKSQDD